MMQNRKDVKPVKDMNNNWRMTTKEAVNGVVWRITTLKSNTGLLYTSAQELEGSMDQTESYMVFRSKSITLIKEKVRVTEKAVIAQFFKALELFDSNEEIQNYSKGTIEVGQLMLLWGYGQEYQSQRKLAIYDIKETKWGKTYHYVNIESLELGTAERIRPIEEQYGIGYYYHKNETIDTKELKPIVIKAKAKKEEERKAQEAKNKRDAAIFSENVSKGKDILTIPKWAKSVIVAERYQNDSDSMTDYFSTSIQDSVFLTFSKSTRNNMNELKKAAVLFDETKDFINNPDFENKDGSAQLPDYYLGSSSWSGWKVSKASLGSLTGTQENILYVAAAKGKFLNPSFLKGETEIPHEIEGVEIFDYSEKAFALIGDTEAISTTIKQLGGRYNKNLKCGPGWIFPKTKLDLVKKTLDL